MFSVILNYNWLDRRC